MLVVAHEQGGPAYALGAAEQLPFRSGSFDLVSFVTSLEFVERPEIALAEAARVARHGLLLGVLNAASPLGVGRKSEAQFRPTVFRGARFYTPWGLSRLIRRTLPERASVLGWSTVVWPDRTPAWLRRQPLGGCIGMAVGLDHARAIGGSAPS
jgi:SAM-dependent methyltransferase